MDRLTFSGWLACALLALPALLFAHHGTAPNYDHKKAVKIEGVVKEFWWRNPHSALFIEGTSSTGTKGTFVLELGAPSALLNNYGYGKKTFQPGDKVIIQMNPSFTTPTNGQAMQGHFWVNGKEFKSKNGKD